MSVTYHIACLTCREYLWIGQTPECLYSGERHTMEALRQFFFRHVSGAPRKISASDEYHELVFIPEPFNSAWEPTWEAEKWKEIDANDYKGWPMPDE